MGGAKVKVKVLEPFETKGMTIDSVPNITKHLQTLMQTELDKLNREVGVDPKYLVDSTCNHKSNEKCGGQQKADSWDHESKKID